MLTCRVYGLRPGSYVEVFEAVHFLIRVLLQRCCLELGLLYFGDDGDGREAQPAQPDQPARIQAAALPRALFSCNVVV